MKLTPTDDLPIHEVSEPDHLGWAERFYFNVLRPTGEIEAIVGGGVYPARGTVECYYCRLDGDLQVNVRASSPLLDRSNQVEAGPFAFCCETPLRDWRVGVDAGDERFAGTFRGRSVPFPFSLLDVPASEPDGPYDRFRHFVATGLWEGTDRLGVRDRTWGVRTRRIRLHNWYVFQLGEHVLSLIHQEWADGSIFFSEAGVVHPGGRIERLAVEGHDLRYDPQTREIVEGAVDLGTLRLEYERVGRPIRLAGAGYDDEQGRRGASDAWFGDEYDLADPEVARRTGRGTMDAGARGQVTGAWSAEGIGVVETAIARDHVRYGAQIA